MNQNGWVRKEKMMQREERRKRWRNKTDVRDERRWMEQKIKEKKSDCKCMS